MQLQEIIPRRNFHEFSAITVTWFNGFRTKNAMISKRMVFVLLAFFPLFYRISVEFGQSDDNIGQLCVQNAYKRRGKC